jgi:hypothetical protein
MGRRSTISTLPEALRRELDELLVSKNFSDYEGIAAWLQERGYDISKSSVHRHGSALEQSYDEAMADARGLLALTRASGDLGDSGSELARSAATLLQTDIVRTVLEIRKEADPEIRAGLLAKLTRAQADIGRLSIAAEKWQRELAAKVQAAAKAISQIAEKGGMTADLVAEQCQQLYGIMK